MTNSRFNANSPLHRFHRRRGVAVAVDGRRVSRKSFSPDEERLLKQLLAGEQDFIDNAAFYVKDAYRKIYEEAPAVKKPDASWYHPVMDDLNAGRGRLPKTTEQVILTGAEERVLFLQYNYARCQIFQVQKAVWAQPDRKPSAEQAESLLNWYRKADDLR